MELATIEESYKIAIAAGMDAGNRNMKKFGRRRWNAEDSDKAAEVATRILAGGIEREKEAGYGR